MARLTIMRTPAFSMDRLAAIAPWISTRTLLRASLALGTAGVLAIVATAIPAVFGHEARVVMDDRMSPAIRPGSLVVSGRVPPEAIRPGDVVTYRLPEPSDLTVTRRVTGIRTGEAGVPLFHTRADSRAAGDGTDLTGDLPVSRMLYAVPYAGYVVAFASGAVGRLLLFIVPLLTLVALGIRAIVEPRERGHGDEAAGALPAFEATIQAAASRAIEDATRDTGRIADADLEALRPAGLGRTREDLPAPPVDAGPRWIDRIDRSLGEHLSLVERLRTQLEAETAPVRAVMERQAAALERMRSNLERKVEPILRYGEALENDLREFRVLMSSQGADDVSGPLRPYVEEQVRRISDTREQVERIRGPFEEYARAQHRAVEALFAPFAVDVGRLQRSTAAQARALGRVLDAIRSDEFERAVSFLDQRADQLVRLAEAGASDPRSVNAALLAPATASDEIESSTHLEAVCEVLAPIERALREGRDAEVRDGGRLGSPGPAPAGSGDHLRRPRVA